MDGRIRNVVFDAPYAGSLELYSEAAGAIATLYSQLLGMRKRTRAEIYRQANYPADAGDDVDPIVVPADEDGIGIAFESQGEGYQAPRWPDPSFPQQMHLDVFVADLATAQALVLALGATKLRDGETSRTYADRVGHPFCLRVDPSAMASGLIGRIVFDCFSPRSLAAFYADLMDMAVRVEDASGCVVIARDDGRLPMLAFQHGVLRTALARSVPSGTAASGPRLQRPRGHIGARPATRGGGTARDRLAPRPRRSRWPSLLSLIVRRGVTLLTRARERAISSVSISSQFGGSSAGASPWRVCSP